MTGARNQGVAGRPESVTITCPLLRFRTDRVSRLHDDLGVGRSPFYVVKTGAIRTGRPVPNLTADWTDHRGGTREEKKSPEKGCRVAQERR